eukprot:CAMPEP_0177645714 /NCGR_PEP_ID=MMETSP0447-20121125/9393_1 /TAXON_ID=0 /ORGANISM="Stygamoeba regulata, Strain BSH-02190019" /LENGTH=516 /DNA_ID=CAMNT_0019148209 /DNA_START=116 /DNA_END=1662 /DNA_ORIENTATION=-
MAERQVIVVGGGLAGLSAAHTVLQAGGSVLLLDKSPFCGGNSTKATSGINGALTRTQISEGIPDSAETFYQDTIRSARDRVRPELARVLTYESGAAVEWLMDSFGLDLSKVARLGGHSHPRTHRGKERFPGMTITYALMEKLEEICKTHPHRARQINKARVVKLLRDADGKVCGCVYEKDGATHEEYGAVIVATGGYAADFNEGSILLTHRPDLKSFSTTNGEHCTGDGIKFSMEVGAGLVDIECVQVHPTGLVDPADPDAKVKFLAAEALRGVGGILLTARGERFVDELGHRDYVSGEMHKNTGPFYLVLNGAASTEIEWHCKHYCGRGLMRHAPSFDALAAMLGASPATLRATFNDFNAAAQSGKDRFGRKYFHNMPWKTDDFFHVAQVTPVVHYCMGGLAVNAEAEVVSPQGVPVGNLYAAGEVCGGVHGTNRLGGSSLLDCVVYGRVAGRTAVRHQLGRLLAKSGAGGVGGAADAPAVTIQMEPGAGRVHLEVSWRAGGSTRSSASAAAPAA